MSGDRDLGITFAGGGNRAFYQLGLMNRWGERLLPRVAAMSTCSAGACVAVMYLTRRREAAREVFLKRTKGLTRNVDLRRGLRGEPIAPHGRIYREILLCMLAEGGLDAIRSLPFPVYVLASTFPAYLPGAVAAFAGILAYQTEKALRPRMVHPRLGRALGFRPLVVDMRACDRVDELADLVLSSSATPPFTPLGRFGGRRLLDGGLIDNVPAFVADAAPGVRRNLVMLTRPYPPEVLGRRGSRLYVAPREPVPIERWDYTRPHALEDTVDRGERDAAGHEWLLTEFLSDRLVSDPSA